MLTLKNFFSFKSIAYTEYIEPLATCNASLYVHLHVERKQNIFYQTFLAWSEFPSKTSTYKVQQSSYVFYSTGLSSSLSWLMLMVKHRDLLKNEFYMESQDLLFFIWAFVSWTDYNCNPSRYIILLCIKHGNLHDMYLYESTKYIQYTRNSVFFFECTFYYLNFVFHTFVVCFTRHCGRC